MTKSLLSRQQCGHCCHGIIAKEHPQIMLIDGNPLIPILTETLAYSVAYILYLYLL